MLKKCSVEVFMWLIWEGKNINLVPDKNQFPLKVFDEIDGSLNVAYDNGFAAVLANIVVGLAGDKLGAVKWVSFYMK